MNEVALLKLSYQRKRVLIRSRLSDFKGVLTRGDDLRIFEELAFCIFTAGTSAKMGLRAVESVKGILMYASKDELSKRLKTVHRFPNSRAMYIYHTRQWLKTEFNFRLKDLIDCLKNPLERRDFFAMTKEIKGIGYKEASHFLRNIGCRGYAILDKHILRTLYELNIIDSPRPPASRTTYLAIEKKLKKFAKQIEVDFDELDLLLWSEKTGEILK